MNSQNCSLNVAFCLSTITYLFVIISEYFMLSVSCTDHHLIFIHIKNTVLSSAKSLRFYLRSLNLCTFRQIYSKRNTRHDIAPCCSFFVASNFFNQFTLKNYIKFKSNIKNVFGGIYLWQGFAQ